MHSLNQTETTVKNIRPVSTDTSLAGSEIVLLERCKAGESAAWDMLIRKYEKSVYKFAYSLCRNHEEAESRVTWLQELGFSAKHED